MSYRLRPVRPGDIPQVTDIDLACFPTMLPPINYKSELINPMARYLVAVSDVLPERIGEIPVPDFIPAFAGLWLMAGEAHVINIAVREGYRRQGLGELLFIGLIQMARELQAVMITLEARASNATAQRLYAKYGFTERGRRRAYYTDNREDAVIMTLDAPNSPEYEAIFGKLRQKYEARWQRTTALLSESGLSES